MKEKSEAVSKLELLIETRIIGHLLELKLSAQFLE
jgi:hypothetical protein